MENGIQLIKVTEIKTSGLNPRKTFSENSIAELSESIKSVGVLQPIIVRPASHAKIKYEIVCGERRYRASLLAGIETIPAIVKVLTDADAFELMITENLQREDVNPLEEAEAYQRLITKMKYQVSELCIRFGKSETYIRHRIKLNDLIPDYTKLLSEEKINLTMAIEIAKLNDSNQAKLYDEFFKENYYMPKNLSDLKAKIDNFITNKLADAKFSLTEDFAHAGACNTCLKNTACDGILFPEEPENGRCMDKDCFKEKTTQHVISLAKIVQESEPGILIIEGRYGSSKEEESQKFVDAGIDICKFPDGYHEVNQPEAPKKPTAPVKENYNDDEEDYQYAINEFHEELQEYENDINEFPKKLAEFQRKVESANYRKAFFATGWSAGKVVYLDRYSHSDDSLKNAGNSAEANLQSEIAELKHKDRRNFEISFDKSYQQVRKLVFDYENKEAGKLVFESDAALSNNENDAMILIMVRNCNCNEFILNVLKNYGYESNYTCDDVSLEIIQKLTIAEKNRIKRSWILHQMKSTLALPKNEYDKIFIEIVKEHYPDETNTILLDEQGKYLKKQDIINKKIEEIEVKLIKSVTK